MCDFIDEVVKADTFLWLGKTARSTGQNVINFSFSALPRIGNSLGTLIGFLSTLEANISKIEFLQQQVSLLNPSKTEGQST